MRALRTRSRASALLHKSLLIHDVAFIFDKRGLGRDDPLAGKAFSAPELAVAAKALLEIQAYKTVFTA
ncbi:hypothetical protein PSCICF_08750 [Pseudomonas cichorii]|nr:hypothetical protein PSCICF_08750 [Pseudomonas cichorii]GFM60567.1 hypothetical protein PSCICG_17270 [Pseudomonas cichorii]